MEQPVSRIRHSSLPKIIVALLGSLCTIALCLPSAIHLIHYYQVVSMVRGLPAQYSTDDYNQLYSPDLSSVLVFNRKTSQVIVWDYATQRILQHIDPGPGSEMGGPAWSPDKRYLLYGRLSDTVSPYLDLWDLSRQTKVFSVARKYGIGINFQQAIWSPDNTRIALLYGGSLTLLDAATGNVLVQYQPGADENMTMRTIAWSPDGKRIAASYSNDSLIQVRILNASTLGVASEALRTDNGAGGTEDMHIQLAWSPDGTSIAAYFGQQVWLVNPTDGAKTRQLNDQYQKDFTTLTWSPDSKLLAVFRWYGEPENSELAIWRVADLQKIQVIYRGNSLGVVNLASRLYWPPKEQRILLITSFSGNQESVPLSGW